MQAKTDRLEKGQLPLRFRVSPDPSRRLLWPQFTVRVDGAPISLDRRITACFRASWAWLISAGMHAFVTLFLMICTTSSDEPRADIIHVTDTQRLESEMTQPRRLEKANFGVLRRTASVDSSLGLTADSHLPDAKVTLVAAPKLGSDAGGRGLGAGPTDEARALVQAHGELMTEIGQFSRGTQFFGIEAKGNRFVFVVDSSGSMKWAKWKRACRELVASVKTLGPHQSFCVFFFDSSPHLMFNQRPAELSLINATPHNVIRLRRWMASIPFGNETRPYSAVRYALALRPDAIFLLSDGEFQDSTLAYLRAARVDEAERAVAAIVVHTVGFTSRAGQETLRQIARETGGEYRFVP